MSTTTDTTVTTTTERRSGRHPVNVGHLVMGIAFLAMVGVWALVQGDVVGDGDVRWLLPVPWVLAGAGGLVALALTGSRRWASRQTGWVDTPAAPVAPPTDDTTTTDMTTDTTTDTTVLGEDVPEDPDKEDR